MRRSMKEANKYWIEVLNDFKSHLENNDVKVVTLFFKIREVSPLWVTFLIKYKVIYKHNGYYVWNDKIPVSLKLIDKYRSYSKESYNKVIKTEEHTSVKQIDNEINFLENQNIGIIRKFLKWLW